MTTPPTPDPADQAARVLYHQIMRQQALVAEEVAGGYSLWNNRWEETFGGPGIGVTVDPEATSFKADGTIRLSGPQVTRPIWQLCQEVARQQADRGRLTRPDGTTLKTYRAAFEMTLRANLQALSDRPASDIGDLVARREELAARLADPVWVGAQADLAAKTVDRYVADLPVPPQVAQWISEVRAERADDGHATAVGIVADGIAQDTQRSPGEVLSRLVVSDPAGPTVRAADLVLAQGAGHPLHDQIKQQLVADLNSTFARLAENPGTTAGERREAAVAVANGALHDTRRALRSLQPDPGLAKTLHQALGANRSAGELLGTTQRATTALGEATSNRATIGNDLSGGHLRQQ